MLPFCIFWVYLQDLISGLYAFLFNMQFPFPICLNAQFTAFLKFLLSVEIFLIIGKNFMNSASSLFLSCIDNIAINTNPALYTNSSFLRLHPIAFLNVYLVLLNRLPQHWSQISHESNSATHLSTWFSVILSGSSTMLESILNSWILDDHNCCTKKWLFSPFPFAHLPCNGSQEWGLGFHRH